VIDLRGDIPVMLTITTGKVHDVKALDSLRLPPGSIVVLDAAMWTLPVCMHWFSASAASSSGAKTI
jgi:hypothetical protein